MSARPRTPVRSRVVLLTLCSGLFSGAAFLSAVFVSAPAAAVSTRSFVLDDAASFGLGELEHVAVRSDGRVVPSIDSTRIALPDDVGLVWSGVVASDGAVYLGTGESGRIYRLRGENLELFAETGQLLVGALTFGERGVLYAGTLPEGRIFAIDTAAAAPAPVRELSRPAPTDGTPGAEHIWDLAFDARNHRLYAATGPEGRVYAIDVTTGAASIYFDTLAEHVMSLALGADGALYAGTTDEALVLRITAANRAEVVDDFPGNEITALALRDGVLAVAANEFGDPPIVTGGTTKRSAGAARSARPRPGKAIVYRVGADGRSERVYSQDDGHVTRLEIGEGGVIYAAIGAEGRIVRIEADRSSSIWADVDERQVLAMSLTGSSRFFATGDGAAVYRVTDAAPRGASWVSKVLDAEFRARWGGLDWRGSGALRFETRSGNTARPDDTWSAWSTAITTPGPIGSAASRFLQIRAVFPDGVADAELRAVTAYYLPENQRPVVSGVGLKRTPTKRAEGTDPSAPPAATPLVALSWTLDNPDGDRMRYRLRYRAEDQTVWRSMLEEHETLSAAEYSWDTSALPDGFYLVEVEASDELSNPSDLVLRSSALSEPLLVDNHAPTVSLSASGTVIRGEAIDTLGPILRLEIATDGGDFHLLFPEDDLFDAARERFEVDAAVLGLTPGPHIIAVRAFDTGGNQGSAEAVVTIAAPAPRARPR